MTFARLASSWVTAAWLAFAVILLAPSRETVYAQVVARVALTVRPRAMATGTVNPAAGIYSIDSLPEMTPDVRKSPYQVYIPPSCVGARRCPLLVHLHGAGQTGSASISEFRAAAEKYGFIVLGPTAVTRLWAVGVADSFPMPTFEPDRKNIDAAMRQVLQTYAIDPTKIVISGVSQGTWPAQMLGGTNMNVFSRVVMFGGVPPLKTLDPPSKATEFLTIDEFPFAAAWIWNARDMRCAGYRLKHIAALAGHGVHPETADFVGQWLRESWAIQNPARRRSPRIIHSIPLLTLDALARMRAFDPGAVSDDLRTMLMRETIVSILTERPSTVMVDTRALAAKSPAVARALTRVGLTAEQYDAYRLALISARLTLEATEGSSADRLPAGMTIDSTSVLGKNVAFVKAHVNDVSAVPGLFGTP